MRFNHYSNLSKSDLFSWYVNFHLGSLITKDFGLNPIINITFLNLKFFENGKRSWQAVSLVISCSYQNQLIKIII